MRRNDRSTPHRRPTGANPAQPCLHRQAWQFGSHHGLLGVGVGVGEKLPARERHDPGGTPCRECCGSLDADRHLAAGADKGEDGIVGFLQNICAGTNWRAGEPSRTGRFCRDMISAVGPPEPTATFHASIASFASAGRITRSPGMARSEAICSTG